MSPQAIIDAGIAPFLAFVGEKDAEQTYAMGDTESCVLHDYFKDKLTGMNHVQIFSDGVEINLGNRYYFEENHWMGKLQDSRFNYDGSVMTVSQIIDETLQLIY